MNQDSTVSPFAFSVPGQPCAKTFVFPPPTLRTVTPDMALPPRLEQSVNSLHSLRNGALKPLSRQPFYGSNQSLNSMGCTPVPPSTPLTLPNPHLEPIEGGLVTKSRSRSNSNYDAMTDDEREEAQRMKRKEEAFKTALCDAYKRTGACSYGDTCRFAHGEQELRLPPQPRGKAHPKYKTQLCDKFSLYGICPYGQRCQFIHKLKKGFPLVEYERLVSQGQISPAREHEIKLVDQSPVKSGWQTLRLDVPPPSMLKTRNGREVQLTKEKVDLPHKRQFGKELNNRVSSNFINQRAARLEAKRRHVLEEALHDAVRQEEEERRDLERRAEERIKRIQEQIHSLNMDEYGYGNPLARSSSLHSLVDNNRSARCNVREAEMRGQFASHTDLSLITEEPDKENYDGSFVPRMTGDERVDAGWQEMIFGKKYHGMGDCDVGFHEDVQDSGNSGHDLEDCQDTADRNLLVQSCDEELLTQGLYDFRYADPSHIVEGWRRSENAYSNGH